MRRARNSDETILINAKTGIKMMTLTGKARSILMAPVLLLAGCAHLANYYETNVDGNTAVTTMGCFGPSSEVFIQPVPGISVSAGAASRPLNPIKVRIEIYSGTGGQFAFTSGLVLLKSSEFREPMKVEMEAFTADYQEGFVARPTDSLIIQPKRRFDTYVESAVGAKYFDLQLPDARANGRLISFPVMHFKSAVKAYIGVCEA